MRRLDSTNSTWLFDSERMQFCRLPRGIDPKSVALEGEWRPYYGLQLDDVSGSFTVALNTERTRLLRAWRQATEPTKELEFHPEIAG